jgi:beta-N-acetylhexosaminidase
LYYGFETAIEKALEAGVDILAFANNSVYQEDVIARAVTFQNYRPDRGY